MPLRKFAERIIDLIITIIVTFAISYPIALFFYKKSQVFPDPVFLLDPSRTIILDSARFTDIPLRVIRSNGSEIKEDVTSLRFYFWNNGRMFIKQSNILKPLFITLDDPNGEILDYRILKCSREVVEPIIERSSVDPNKSLSLSFKILEQEDGLSGQIVYKGRPDAGLMISGEIEQVRDIKRTTTKLVRNFVYTNTSGLIFEVFLIWLSLTLFWVRYYLLGLSKSEQKLTVRDKMKKMVILIVVQIALTVLFLYVGYDAFKWGKQEVLTSVIHIVPKNIIP